MTEYERYRALQQGSPSYVTEKNVTLRLTKPWKNVAPGG